VTRIAELGNVGKYFKLVSVALFVVACALPAIQFDPDRDSVPGWLLLVFGGYGFSHLKPSFAGLSWLANVCFLLGLPNPRSEERQLAQKGIVAVGLGLALLFLTASQYLAGDTIKPSRWYPLELEVGYFIWVLAQVVLWVQVWFFAPQATSPDHT
jgi:hypothetical protein